MVFDHVQTGNRTKSPREHPVRFVLLMVFLISVTALVIRVVDRPPPVVSPIPDEDHPVITPSRKSILSQVMGSFSGKKDPEELKAKIEEIVGDKWLNYSVLVKDFKSPLTAAIGDSIIYEAASVSKVPIIAALYYYAQKGDVDLDKVITLQQNDIQDYGTGNIRYNPPGSTYSVKTLAKLMIQQSDNTAAYIIANHIVGLDKIQSLMESWSMDQTDIMNNKISNKDTAIVFEKIYSGKVAGKALTEEMLSFFVDTDFEDRIPALLPKTARVYHKIGNGIGNIHDVGIVESGKHSYYIGILTSDITNEPEAIETSAMISKVVYEYLQ